MLWRGHRDIPQGYEEWWVQGLDNFDRQTYRRQDPRTLASLYCGTKLPSPAGVFHGCPFSAKELILMGDDPVEYYKQEEITLKEIAQDRAAKEKLELYGQSGSTERCSKRRREKKKLVVRINKIVSGIYFLLKKHILRTTELVRLGTATSM